MRSILMLSIPILMTIPLCCFGQDSDFENEMEEIKQRSERSRLNEELIRGRIANVRPYVRLNHDLQIETVYFGKTYLKSDQRLYEFVLEMDLKQFELGPTFQAQILSEAREIRERWKKCFAEVAQHNNLDLLNSVEDEIIDYEKRMFEALSCPNPHGEIFDNLGPNLKDIWATFVVRERILNKGIPRNVDDDEDLTREQKQEMKKTLTELAAKIKIDGNRLFVDKAKQLFPELFGDLDEQFPDELPLLPLKCFLTTVAQPEIANDRARRLLEEFDIRLSDGEWQFPSPCFELCHNSITLSDFIVEGLIPIGILFHISERSKLSLTDQQKLELHDLIETRHQTNLGTADRNEARQIVFHHRHSGVKWAKKNLLPEQLKLINDYLRIHMLFTLGPNAVWEHLDEDQRMSEQEFIRLLDEIVKSLETFVDESEAKLTETMAEKSHSWNFSFHNGIIDAPNHSDYERWFGPLLMKN